MMMLFYVVSDASTPHFHHGICLAGIQRNATQSAGYNTNIFNIEEFVNEKDTCKFDHYVDGFVRTGSVCALSDDLHTESRFR
jgi:hypothetical protein